MKRIKYILLLSKYIKNYWTTLLISIVIHGIYKIMPIALGFETSYIVSKAFNGSLNNPDLHFYGVTFMVIATAILNYLDIYISHDVAYRILTQLRTLSYEKLMYIAPAGLEGEKSGNIMSIILEDVEILEWFYAHSIIQVFVSIILPLISLIIMAKFSIYLSITILLFIILLMFEPYLLRKKSDTQGYELQKKLGDLNACIIDGIQGIKEILIFQWQKIYFVRMYKANDDYNTAYYEYSKRSVREVSTFSLIIGISSVVSAIMIVYFARVGRYSYEMILPLISLSTMIYSPLRETLAMSSNYGRIFAAAKRVFDFMQLDATVSDEGNITYDDVIKEDKGEVYFNSVYFSYVDKDTGEKNSVLKGISFVIEKNQTTVLVGSSGSGKSTCSKLLQRFWDVDSGSILINGIDIKKIRLEDLKKLISVVPQEVYIFNKSIRENLQMANENASIEDIELALKNANLKDFVYKLDEGLDTIAGERGAKLSGGERQRLSIAQAFIKNSPILILDEITANLDYNNEVIINNSLNKLKKDKITLMIAHRVSTIKNADKIIFIEDGICVGSGKYEDLINENEKFRELIGEKSR